MSELFHYTDIKGLKGILEKCELWATHFSYLNDNSEFRYAAEQLIEKLRVKVTVELFLKLSESSIKQDTDAHESFTLLALSELQRKLATIPAYVLCFAKHESNSESAQNGLLSQWQIYSKLGGYCLVFDDQKIFSNLEIQFFNKEISYGVLPDLNGDLSERIAAYLFNVSTTPSDVHFEADLDNFITPIADEIFNIIAFIKHPAFESENECRFVVRDPSFSIKTDFRERDGTTLVPYIKLPFKKCSLKRIIVGPGPDTSRRHHSLKMFLKSLGAGHVELEISEIPIGST